MHTTRIRLDIWPFFPWGECLGAMPVVCSRSITSSKMRASSITVCSMRATTLSSPQLQIKLQQSANAPKAASKSCHNPKVKKWMRWTPITWQLLSSIKTSQGRSGCTAIDANSYAVLCGTPIIRFRMKMLEIFAMNATTKAIAIAWEDSSRWISWKRWMWLRMASRLIKQAGDSRTTSNCWNSWETAMEKAGKTWWTNFRGRKH